MNNTDGTTDLQRLGNTELRLKLAIRHNIFMKCKIT